MVFSYLTRSIEQSASTPNQIWFITGSSRGFGRALVSAALKAADSVVATARRPDRLAEFVEQYGDRVLPIALNVTDVAAVHAALKTAVNRFGRIDVLVNKPVSLMSLRLREQRTRIFAPSLRRTFGLSTT